MQFICIHTGGNKMKTYLLKPTQTRRLAGLAQVIFLFIIWPLTTVCFGDPQTNTIPWSDAFEAYTNLTPLINGTNGWYASSSACLVQTNVRHSGDKAAMLPAGETLSNSFAEQTVRNVKLEMYVQPQLMTSNVYPRISSNVSAQFFINSNGYFVVGNGSSWSEATSMPDGAAISITNINNSTNFVRVQIHLQYNTHLWGLKAWTNDTLVASTNYLSFASNLNNLSGFTVYSGDTTNYFDDVSAMRWPSFKVNGVSLDNVRYINDTVPGVRINGVDTQ